jgi:ribA/ribD-fused uncharacterized protein
MKDEIMIESFSGPFANFSNFAPCEVELWKRVYPSVEHAYQSAKNNGEEWKKFCQSDVTAGKVKQATKHVVLIKEWEDIKVQLMRNLVWQKFNKEPFRTLLLSTNDSYIQEGNWWGDTFWGVNLKTGFGKNVLGYILMEIRAALKGV